MSSSSSTSSSSSAGPSCCRGSLDTGGLLTTIPSPSESESTVIACGLELTVFTFRLFCDRGALVLCRDKSLFGESKLSESLETSTTGLVRGLLNMPARWGECDFKDEDSFTGGLKDPASLPLKKSSGCCLDDLLVVEVLVFPALGCLRVVRTGSLSLPDSLRMSLLACVVREVAGIGKLSFTPSIWALPRSLCHSKSCSTLRRFLAPASDTAAARSCICLL